MFVDLEKLIFSFAIFLVFGWVISLLLALITLFGIVTWSPGIPEITSPGHFGHFRSGPDLTPVSSLPTNNRVHLKMTPEAALPRHPYTPPFHFPFWVWLLLGTPERYKLPGTSVTSEAPTLPEKIHIRTNLGQSPPRGLSRLFTTRSPSAVELRPYRVLVQ